MIRPYCDADFEQVRATINDAAQAYRGTIPAELYREPWMSAEYLTDELARGVIFYCHESDGTIDAVMGIQEFPDVTLLRHSYVRTAQRRSGLGSLLIEHHKSRTTHPILVGCLKAMTWAISFYQRHGFTIVSDAERDRLRAKYWNLPAAHVANSVVLADRRWLDENGRSG